MSHKPLIMEAGQLKQSGIAEIDAATIEYSEGKEYPANTLPAKLNSLLTQEADERFKLIYFNETSQANPDYAMAGRRYVFDNPFPKSPVITMAEIFTNNVWGETGWIYVSNMGAGVKASHIIETDQIVVQIGQKGVGCTQSSYTGSPAGETGGAYIYSAPCRIKVFKIM